MVFADETSLQEWDTAYSNHFDVEAGVLWIGLEGLKLIEDSIYRCCHYRSNHSYPNNLDQIFFNSLSVASTLLHIHAVLREILGQECDGLTEVKQRKTGG